MKVTFELIMNVLVLAVNLTASIISFIMGNVPAGFAWASCCCWIVVLMICDHRCRKSEEAWIELFHDRAFIINLALVMEKEQKEPTQDDNQN